MAEKLCELKKNGGSSTSSGQILGSFYLTPGQSYTFSDLKTGDLLFGSGTPFTSSFASELNGFTQKTATAVIGSTIVYLQATRNAPSVTLQNLGGHQLAAIGVRL